MKQITKCGLSDFLRVLDMHYKYKDKARAKYWKNQSDKSAFAEMEKEQAYYNGLMDAYELLTGYRSEIVRDLNGRHYIDH